ncbi:MAG: glycogen synthase [Gammaproteobacteria bacterium]|nr:glycogen synthase [Gammaproteobacteria bacterium]MBT8053992.1 glycogen synthase [Gammaproteobacteria bacterium]
MAKTGGLADVCSALSAYFDANGHEVRVLVPFYPSLDTAGYELENVKQLQDMELTLGDRTFHYWIVKAVSDLAGPDVHLIQCPELYNTEDLYSGPDEHLRFVLLSRAAIEMCQRIDFVPDIFHCHDWHTALVPLYLKSVYSWDRKFSETRSVLTIHNIGYQGVFGADIVQQIGLAETTGMLDQDDLDGGRINFLKSGVMHADLLTTVSPTYSREILEPEYGMGLEGHLRARGGSVIGILNGVDYAEWDPQHDPLIPFNYSQKDLIGKEKNKRALMEEIGLDYQFDKPLVGMVGRLSYQKGIDLVQEVLPDLLSSRDFSVAVLGDGESQYTQFFHWMHGKYTGRVSFYDGFNNPLAHRIEAGSDIFLMPSRYEPCGLNQMYSLKYGTVPVVRATGGLADSVQHFDPSNGQGTGVVFHDYDANGLRWAMNAALDLYGNKNAWKRMVFNGMAKNYSWDEQGRIYLERFRRLFDA